MSSETVGQTLPSVAGDETGIAAMVANRYRIVRWLGGGGMGRVYEAHDTELDERVALKVLRAGLSEDALERFRREVRLTRRIQHRNVARMFDIGDHEGDRFLTMELIAGDALTRTLAARPTWKELRALALQLCAGLAAAHAAGVVHRDLKPDNVLVEHGTGRVVITDFGIARSSRTSAEAMMTQEGAIIGTPRYMSPEQLAGGAIDARADLFSLGVMLFEIASGRPPWPGDSAISVAVAQATKPPGELSGRALPSAAVSLIQRCLALDPAGRPASADEVAQALAAIDENAAPARAPKPTAAPSRPTPWPIDAAPTQASSMTTLAVLPFECAPADGYLADGLREDLTDTLSVVGTLRVRPAGGIAAGVEPRAAGAELGVDHVVTGALRRTPSGAIRMIARLVSVADGFQIWATRKECEAGNVLAISDSLGRGIAEALSTRAMPLARSLDPRAVELYLRAREEMRRFWGDHALRAAELLEEAVAIDPDAPAMQGARALALATAWARGGAPDVLVRAREATARALNLGAADGSLASGLVAWNLGNVERAARDFREALARAPMSAMAHELTGRLLAEIVGAEARHYFETASALDPGRAQMVATDLSRLDAFAGNWEAAYRRAATLADSKDRSLATLGEVYQARLAGWREDIGPAFERVRQLGSRTHQRAHRLFEIVYDVYDRGRPFDHAAWRATLAEHATLAPDEPRRAFLVVAQRMTELAILLKQREAALEALELATSLGLVDIVWLDECPLFRMFYTDARFETSRQTIATRAANALARFRGTKA